MSLAESACSILAASALMRSISFWESVTFSRLDELASVELFKFFPRVVWISVKVLDDNLSPVDKLDGDAAREPSGFHQVLHDGVGKVGLLERAEHDVFLVRLLRKVQCPLYDTVLDLLFF